MAIFAHASAISGALCHQNSDQEDPVTTIIAAIAVGMILLWGGIAGLLHLVELFERKHVLALGAYTTLVAGLVMGLVLFNAHERQKEHQRDLQDQMATVTKRLSDLSERLVGQLAEKADLTASEFEIRANLQTERSQHANTRATLAEQEQQYAQLRTTLEGERKARLSYQQDINRKLDERSTLADERSRLSEPKEKDGPRRNDVAPAKAGGGVASCRT